MIKILRRAEILPLLPVIAFVLEDILTRTLTGESGGGYTALLLIAFIWLYNLKQFPLRKHGWIGCMTYSKIYLIFAFYGIAVTVLHFIFDVRDAIGIMSTVFIIVMMPFYFQLEGMQLNTNKLFFTIVLLNLAVNIYHMSTLGSVGIFRYSRFLNNIYFFITFQMLLMPCNLIAAKHYFKSRPARLMAWANVICYVVSAVWSGSRVFSVMAFMSLIVLGVVLGFSDWPFTLKTASALGLSVLTCMMLYQTNAFYGATAIERSFFLSENASIVEPAAVPETQRSYSVMVENVSLSHESAEIVGDLGRAALVGQSLEEVGRSPIIGTGKLLFRLVYDDGTTVYNSPHNIIIECLLMYGIIGLLIYLILLIIPFLRAIQIYTACGNDVFSRDVAACIVIVILSLFLSSLFQPLMLSLLVNTLFWPILGICFYAIRQSERKRIDAMV